MATFRTLHIFPRHGRDVYGNEDTGEVQINADAVRLLRVNEDGRVRAAIVRPASNGRVDLNERHVGVSRLGGPRPPSPLHIGLHALPFKRGRWGFSQRELCR